MLEELVPKAKDMVELMRLCAAYSFAANHPMLWQRLRAIHFEKALPLLLNSAPWETHFQGSGRIVAAAGKSIIE